MQHCLERCLPDESYSSRCCRLSKLARVVVADSARAVAGWSAGAGLSLTNLLRLEAQAAPAGAARRETSVIILWMRGGPSQLETFDMKPEAPAEVRGEFSPISTTVPGIQVCEHLPLCAQATHKFSIIRSMHFRAEDGMTDHSSGDQVCFTGYPAAPDPSQNVFPSCGSIVKRQLQHQTPDLPAYVMVPRNVPGTASGFFGQSFEPFETLSDPANMATPFSVPNLGFADGISVDRIGSRRDLLRGLDSLRRDMDHTGRFHAIDEFETQAWEMITGAKAREAFDFEKEPRELRDRYGVMPAYKSRVRAGGDAPNWAQRMLLAARLVEAGVRLVTVDCRWWDTHEDNFWALETGFLPRWDRAYSALLEDLERRGKLESTLVIAWGEMGRTPRVNAAAGRDHWSRVFSMSIAGGGVKGGRVVGSTDQHAAEPKDNPKIVQDVLATAYAHLGVNASVQYADRAGRPHPVLPCGRPIAELF